MNFIKYKTNKDNIDLKKPQNYLLLSFILFYFIFLINIVLSYNDINIQ